MEIKKLHNFKDVSKQMQVNPKVELSAFNGEKWIRIEAKVVRDENIEAKKHMLDNYPQLKASYSPEDENTEVLYLKDATATICSFVGEPKIIKF